MRLGQGPVKGVLASLGAFALNGFGRTSALGSPASGWGGTQNLLGLPGGELLLLISPGSKRPPRDSPVRSLPALKAHLGFCKYCKCHPGNF